MKKKIKNFNLREELLKFKSSSLLNWLLVLVAAAIILIVILIISNSRNVQKVMFWQGKVNQHWDIKLHEWATDPDGVSGAELDKLDYCRKFYPKTVSVVAGKEERCDNWREAGNRGKYSSIKTAYLCKQK